jgi:hypothetical protein
VLNTAAATIADTIAYNNARKYLRVFDLYLERFACESGSRLGLKLLKKAAAARGSSW